VANDIRATMQKHAGVFRTQASMDEGVARSPPCASASEKAINLKDKSKVFNTARIEALEVENLIEAPRPPSCRPRPATRAVAPTRWTTMSDTAGRRSPLGRNDTDWHKHTLWYSEGNRLSYKPVQMKPLTVESVPLKVRTF
jgi:succinate dehydrogenase / fumarate reductase flavoprotein subunit